MNDSVVSNKDSDDGSDDEESGAPEDELEPFEPIVQEENLDQIDDEVTDEVLMEEAAENACNDLQ